MKEQKGKRGITLIALIITIIVMLILVAVSIQIVINSNLIGAAEKTVSKYDETGVKDNFSAILGGATIERYASSNEGREFNFEEYLNGTEGVENVTKQADGTYKVEYKGYEIVVEEDGKNYTIVEISP